MKPPREPIVTVFPGRLGWAKDANAYPLPEGLAHKTPVRVHRVLADHDIEVETLDGTIWKVLWWQVEFPRTYHFEGSRREYTEWHPRSRELMAKNLEINRTKPIPQGLGHTHDAAIEHAEWQLERSAQPHPFIGVPKRKDF